MQLNVLDLSANRFGIPFGFGEHNRISNNFYCPETIIKCQEWWLGWLLGWSSKPSVRSYVCQGARKSPCEGVALWCIFTRNGLGASSLHTLMGEWQSKGSGVAESERTSARTDRPAMHNFLCSPILWAITLH